MNPSRGAERRPSKRSGGVSPRQDWLFGRASRGVTIVEMMMAMFVATLIMFCAYVMYAQGRDLMERPRASFSVQEDLMQVARFVSRDLEETNLVTVQSYPNPAFPDEPPGLSLESPRTFDGDQLVMSEFGGVRWQKYVYYTLVPVNDRVGNVVRKEGRLSDQPNALDAERRVPVRSAVSPGAGGDPSRWRIVARNVLLPRVNEPYVVTDEFGGFKVTATAANGSTGPLSGGAVRETPVRVDLAVREVSPRTGKRSVLTMSLQVMPRN